MDCERLAQQFDFGFSLVAQTIADQPAQVEHERHADRVNRGVPRLFPREHARSEHDHAEVFVQDTLPVLFIHTCSRLPFQAKL